MVTSLLFAIVFSLQSHANFAQEFARSFQTEIFWIDSRRLLETSARIHLAQPSLLERWGVINTDAAASYNSLLNTIILKPNAISRDQEGKLRIAAISELRARENSYAVTVSTIFHELAHAEQDMFLEKPGTREDALLQRLMEEEIKPWIERNHSELSFLARGIGLWEIFGYYRGDLMAFILNDRDDILTANGFYQNRCFFSPYLKASAKELSLEEFTKLLPIGSEYERSYGERFSVDFVWARGQEIQLKTKNEQDPFRPEWQNALFQHFRFFYSIPGNKLELLERMNSNLPEKFRSCRREYWQKIRN